MLLLSGCTRSTSTPASTITEMDTATATATATIVRATYSPTPTVPAPQAVREFFQSPTHNIWCEMDFQNDDLPDVAYCQSTNPPQNVGIRSDGSIVSTCTDSAGCVGQGGETPNYLSPVLAYGQRAVVGPFTCLSEESGMTCTAAGRGFTISSAGIAPV